MPMNELSASQMTLPLTGSEESVERTRQVRISLAATEKTLVQAVSPRRRLDATETDTGSESGTSAMAKAGAIRVDTSATNLANEVMGGEQSLAMRPNVRGKRTSQRSWRRSA